jgi:hypothetical protein
VLTRIFVQLQGTGENCVLGAALLIKNPDLQQLLLGCAGPILYSRHGEMRSARRILVGKPERTRALGRCRRRWENNIKIDFREIVWEIVDWILLAKDRDKWRAVLNTLMKR